MKSLPALVLAALFALAGVGPETAAAQQIDMQKLQAMQPRNIGPAGMSGRVTAIDAIVKNPDIIYVGAASGGIWKSTSGGTDWEPIFDDVPVHSIGDITIHQKNPDIIWVGTGEGNPRNSLNLGAGIYRTMDGGKTWELMGLEETRSIHRVIVHPDNPDIVWAGAMGDPWAENEHRGVYKTTDGGETWEKVLYVNERTGVGDMVADPSNPNKILVNMWESHRDAWFYESGGPGSGLHMTIDGGETWTELNHEENGIPEKPMGRMGLAFAPSNPEIVYALIESENNAFYRSEDGGYTWEMTTDENIGGRPFYYADIRVDPKDENRIYNMFSRVSRSIDGGQSFQQIIPYSGVHPDHHAWWIHPEDPSLIYEGNDGGFNISRDRAETWEFVDNIPVAQPYHVTVDMDIPYNVYGGMQDNGTWVGPSAVWRNGGIRNYYWDEILFGDGFDVAIDHTNPRYVYGMSQRGNVRRIDTETGHTANVQPVHPDNARLRFNWNAAIAVSPHVEGTIYFGSQFLHRSSDRGETWEVISPDLTTDDPDKQNQHASGGLTTDATGAENFTTVTAIDESPVTQGVIWVGTDDGNVQVTRNGGESWTNVAGNLPDHPEGSWVHQVHASDHRAGEAFAVINDYRRGNWEPMVYHTDDYGESWENLVADKGLWGYSLSFVQDPVEPNLMFTGTEFGLYVSIDGGETWTQWTNGYPTASTYDMVIHPRDHDLVIAAYGRAFWVLDDIRPLRAMAAEGADVIDQPLTVYPAPTAFNAEWRQAKGTRFDADGGYRGDNISDEPQISYSVNMEELETVRKEQGHEEIHIKVEVLNAQGQVVRTFYEEPENDGLNRMGWEMEEDGVRPSNAEPLEEGEAMPGGVELLPGNYTLRFSYGDYSDETGVELRYDPRMEFNMADLRARRDMLKQMEQLEAVFDAAMNRIEDAEESLEDILTTLETDRSGSDAIAGLIERTETMQDSLGSISDIFDTGWGGGGQGAPNDTTRTVDDELFEAESYISSNYAAPGETERMLLEQGRTYFEDALVELNAFFSGPWAEYRRAVEAAELDFFEENYPPIRLNR
ncbi:MAG: hypothetical protein U5K31_11125 [Balneolaceae bacterium]|nr:hypothetical protein [Balneolaceae bacterium]